jgi:hypothetical protein
LTLAYLQVQYITDSRESVPEHKDEYLSDFVYFTLNVKLHKFDSISLDQLRNPEAKADMLYKIVSQLLYIYISSCSSKHFEEIAAQVGRVSILAASTAASSPTSAAAKLKGSSDPRASTPGGPQAGKTGGRGQEPASTLWLSQPSGRVGRFLFFWIISIVNITCREIQGSPLVI